MGGICMKKNIFVMAMAGAAVLAGCQKEVSSVAPDYNGIVITALSDNEPDAKTTLEGKQVLWNNSDEIAVYNGTAVAKFTTAAEDRSATADFTTENAEFDAVETYLAVYPYSEEVDFSGDKVAVTVPAVQTACAGSFAKGVNVAVAKGSSNALVFQNVCAYLKFTVPAGMEDLKKVVLAANGANEYLAGKVEVSCDNASDLSVTDGVASVTLEGPFEAGKSYYMAVLPQTLSAGFTLTMTRGESAPTMETNKKFTFTRSRTANIGELYDGNWKVSLEGTAVPGGALMTNCGNGYCSFRGNLSKGDLTMRVLYENINLGTVSIPSEGWYHILLDTATREYQIYTQDVFVDLGNVGYQAPWIKVGSATATNVQLNDINGVDSGMVLSLGNGFTLYSAALNDTGINYDYKDDVILMKVWYDGLTFSNSDKTKDSDIKNISISGLDSSAEYDVRVVCARNNASYAARKTKFIIGDDEITINQGFKNEDYGGWTKIPFNQHVGEFSGITTSDGVLVIGVQALAVSTSSTQCSDAHVNAIQIFKKLNQ